MTYITSAPDCARRAEAPRNSLIRVWLEQAKRRHERRIAIRRLRSLDDHLLRDMGIARGQIDDVLRNGRR